MKTCLHRKKPPPRLHLFIVSVAIAALSVVCAQENPPAPAHLSPTLTLDDTRHLLMRTGIGAHPADIIRLRGLSRQQAIDIVIDGISTEPGVPMPDWVNQPLPAYHARADMDSETRTRFNQQRDAELAQLRQWWVLNMLQTNSPQTERLVLFWHDVFATNYHGIGKQSLAMARQNQTFRTLGLGSWEVLVKAMIRDAALLKYLDSGTNHKASPNENLARELMELFVLGEGNYEESTVREAARALTGHDTSRAHDLQFLLKTGAQDRDEKQLFGKTGRFDGDDLVDLLLAQEAAPAFLATKFWYAFISDVAPELSWVTEQAAMFRRSDLDIATLYRNVLQSEAFWHADNRGAMIKSPVDIVAGTARTMDYPMSQWKRMPNWQRLIGMDLFSPPNVAGWKEGAGFINPGHLLNRYKVVGAMIGRAGRAAATKDASMTNTHGKSTMSMSSKTGQGMNMNMQATAGSTDALEPSETPQMPANEHAAVNHQDATIKAAAIHLMRASANPKNERRLVEIVLDQVQTPDKYFHHLRFVVEKRKDQPMTLQLDSFSCWPDCVEPWPECAWVDKHFPALNKIIMPWVAKDSTRWSSKHHHECQFESIEHNEKVLISTLWAELPSLLSQAKITPRVQNKNKRWLPAMQFLDDQHTRALVKLGDTPYASFAGTIDISPSHARSAPVAPELSPPFTQVDSIKTLLQTLSTENMELHELLLPGLSVEQVPDAPERENKRPGQYLKTVLEHPLFQLK